MKVLVTNDDGYTAIGIKKLVEKIKGKYEEIIVIAPKTQKSATSHSIILKGGIEFKQVDDIVEGIKTYYCDGNPADCVSFARCVLKYPYDLVISGCNNGINLGYDVIYSGTVAGAADALINGKKGLAISCKVGDFDSLDNLDMALEFISDNKLFDKCDLINVNLVKEAILNYIDFFEFYFMNRKHEDTHYKEKLKGLLPYIDEIATQIEKDETTKQKTFIN